MAITFPSSPSTGQVFTVGNRSWAWDGSAWKGGVSSTGDAGTLDNLDSLQFLRSDADDSITGQIIFPSTNANKPVFPQGLLARADQSDTTGFHDIWGISERYYPSNSTSGDAWGIRWSGSPNEIQFIGSGSEKFKVDLDTGAATATSFIGDGSNLTGLPAGYTDADVISHLNSKSLYFNGGKIGIGTASPFSKLQVSGHTFSGGNGMYQDSRVGISNHGNLTGMMLASTYDNGTYPEYGLVFVTGPSTSNYNVWSISPDGPTKGDGLNFIYGNGATNIHTGTPKVTFDGNGNVGIGTVSPDSPLVVKSDSGANTFKLIGRSADNISSLTFANAGNTASNYIQGNSSFIRARAEGGFHFRKGGTPVTTDTSGFTIQGLNVGIGTDTPAAPLDFGVTSTNQQVLLLRQNGNSRTGFSISNDYGVRAFGPADASSTGSLFGVGEMTAGTNYLGDLFTVRYDGKVGIGTTSPDYALQVSGPNVPSGGGLATVGIYDDTTPYDGTLPGGGITFRGKYTSNNAITNFATVQGIKENATDGDYDTALRFTTRSNGSNLTEKVRISSSGNVGIGTLIPDAKLHVNGPAIIGSNNNNATTPIAGLHVLDNSYGRWSTTLSKEQVALRVETYWNAAGGQRAVGTYGGGIGFNHLGGHSLTHDENVHAWIGPRVVATPGHETSALVFATNNVTNDEDAGLLERASISPEGRFTFKQTSTNPSQIHNSVGYTDLYKFSFSMSMMGNQAYVIRTSGHSNGIFKALAFGSHWTMTYGLYRESYISLDSVTNFTEDNLHNRTSSQQGGITFSRHSAGEIDIVKSAGTYAGSMFFNIIMYSPRNINVVGIY